MRKAVDTLLFSGDFTPTTFNLAFFMHSLFREDIERESKSLRGGEGRELHRVPDGDGPAAACAAATPVPGVPLEHGGDAGRRRRCARFRRPRPSAAPAGRTRRRPCRSFRLRRASTRPTRSPSTASPRTRIRRRTLRRARPTPGSPSTRERRRAAARCRCSQAASPRSCWSESAAGSPGRRCGRRPCRRRRRTTTLSAEAAAAVARVKELEEKLQAIEAEKAAAEAKAADDAKKKVEAQAAAKGQAVDPAALAKAQEEATKKARAEQEKKAAGGAQAPRRGEEGRGGAAGRGAARKQEEEAARVAAAAATTTLPARHHHDRAAGARRSGAGSLVNLSDPGVIAPVAERRLAAALPGDRAPAEPRGHGRAQRAGGRAGRRRATCRW